MILLRCEHAKPGYFTIVGENNELRAIASREEATRFRVLMFKERLKTKMRGVNLSSWYLPEKNTNYDFFEHRTPNLEKLADELGKDRFRKRYKKNLIEWINLKPVFQKLKEETLSINTVRIPIPTHALLPFDSPFNYTATDRLMMECYQDAMGHLETVFLVAS